MVTRHKNHAAEIFIDGPETDEAFYWEADGVRHGPFPSEREAALDFHGEFPVSDIPECEFCYEHFSGFRFARWLRE